MISGQLLARLLIASSSAVGACAGATSGSSGQPTSADEVHLEPALLPSSSAPRLSLPRASAAGRAVHPPWLVALDPPIPSGWHAIRPPSPPLHTRPPAPRFEATAEQPDDEALTVCTEASYLAQNYTKGEPFFSSSCYERAPWGAECLEATETRLRRALDLAPARPCVADGPYAQTEDRSGAPICCYNVGWVGEGRPLLVAGGLRQAPLALAPGWA